MNRVIAVGLTMAALAIPDRAVGALPDDGDERAAAPLAFPHWRFAVDELDDPTGVAVLDGGLIAVVESGAHRVVLLDGQGQRIRSFGALGDAPGRLRFPTAVAGSGDGRLFVVDSGNHRVQVFDRDGAFLHGWGGRGSAPGEFSDPTGICVDGQGVYVVDAGNRRVQVFDHDGTPRRIVGADAVEGPRFDHPTDVAVDDQGRLYVADGATHRIFRFNAEGGLLTQWGDWGPFSGLLDRPVGLAIHADRLLAAEELNHRIQVFSLDGDAESQWGKHAVLPHETGGTLHYPVDVSVAPDGSFAVVCETFENRIQVFDRARPGEKVEPPRQLLRRGQSSHFGGRIGGGGDLLAITEPENHFVFVYDATAEVPIVITQFGERGFRPGQMIDITGLMIDLAEERLVVADGLTGRLQTYRVDYEREELRRYRPDLCALATSRNVRSGTDPAERIEPLAVVRDPRGGLIVLDAAGSHVLMVDREMQITHTWGSYGLADAQLRRPNDLAVSADGGTIYVVDAHAMKIKAFDREGELRHVWGGHGEGDGRFLQPWGICVASSGDVFVTDAGAHCVQRFGPTGAFLGRWGAFGTDHGEFWKPRGVTEDVQGRIVIVDYGNHRAQAFSPAGEWLVTFSAGRAFTPRMLEMQRRGREQGARQQ